MELQFKGTDTCRDGLSLAAFKKKLKIIYRIIEQPRLEVFSKHYQAQSLVGKRSLHVQLHLENLQILPHHW